MDDVRVHRNSSAPAKLGALAYAQGRDIHLGPGQQQHLPHEAWHVVQQKQGRVPPTLRVGRISINDQPSLEHEADVMGARVASQAHPAKTPVRTSAGAPPSGDVVQGNGIKGLFGAISNWVWNRGPVKTAIFPQGTYVYRADTRAASRIKSDGFVPSTIRLPVHDVTAADIAAYQRQKYKNPFIVSTADSLEGATTFATQMEGEEDKHIYKIDVGGLAEVLPSNIWWLQRAMYAEQEERMVAGGIAPERIKHHKTLSKADLARERALRAEHEARFK
jgi:hypothetical protein